LLLARCGARAGGLELGERRWWRTGGSVAELGRGRAVSARWAGVQRELQARAWRKLSSGVAGGRCG
jgi:hypothetical protein